MAQEKNQPSAESGTEQQQSASATPTWDSYNGEMYPFLNLNEEDKRAGFRVKFLSDKPRKETPNKLTPTATDFWFDVEHDGDTYTWTMSQVSLVMELQKYKPLSGKSFDIKLVSVGDSFRARFPKYKGKDRYDVKPVEGATSATNKEQKVEEETVKD